MEGWTRARLIPVKGIGSDREAEERATSALLAVVGVVRPLSVELFSPMGASRAARAQVDTFTEVIFDHDGRKIRPDGLVQISYAKNTWTALIEVKTGTNALEAEQIQTYIKLARANRFNAVVTISNEIAPAPGIHPTPGAQPRSNSTVALHHISWTQLIATAVRLKEHTGVEDVEQRWILEELIRYLEHRSSGALSFNDMGGSWVAVRSAARDGTLARQSGDVAEVCSRWDQLIRYVALTMGAEIGHDVHQVLAASHRSDAKARADALSRTLIDHGTLDAALRIPNTTGDLEIHADLKARQLTCTTTIKAAEDKGARGRVGWVTRQLKDAPDQLCIESRAHRAKSGPMTTLAEAREDSARLVDD